MPDCKKHSKKPQTFRLWLPDGPLRHPGRNRFWGIYGSVDEDGCMCIDECMHTEPHDCIGKQMCPFLPLEV